MKNNKRFFKYILRVLLISIGFFIVSFNDALGDNEAFAIFALLYFSSILILVLYWIFKQTKSIIRLKNEKAKTELMHLKSQVNPHFFFNMLNNLYGLVDKDSKKAQALILKLSDMMRYSIYDGQQDVVLLTEEVDYIKNYIELHKMRYHKKIDIQFKYSTDKEGYKIMPLLFIILLENAFKHGVENLRENAYVHIDMNIVNHKIQFKIENNFDPTQTTEKDGIGLHNLKRRLELVYPNTHSLSISVTDTVYKAVLNIKVPK